MGDGGPLLRLQGQPGVDAPILSVAESTGVWVVSQLWAASEATFSITEYWVPAADSPTAPCRLALKS